MTDHNLVPVLERIAALLEYSIITQDGYLPAFPAVNDRAIVDRAHDLSGQLWPHLNG